MGCLRDCLIVNMMTDFGKSSNMTMETAGGNALVTISYWKDMEHLHAFAHGPAHRLGWDWWVKENRKHPHIGIMHETYAVPKHAWENIYQNFHPIGMCESMRSQMSLILITDVPAAQIKYPVRESKDAPPKLVSTIMKANGSRWRTMTSRMGGEMDEDGEY